MATCDEIEEALECMECCDALETHLEYCEPDECGVFEAYWRTRYRVEAGECDDWLAPGRAAMVVMMTAEPWMHEHHDHRIVHDDPATLDVKDHGPQPALRPRESASLRRAVRGLRRRSPMSGWLIWPVSVWSGSPRTAQTPPAPPATAVDRLDPPRWWEIDGPVRVWWSFTPC